MTSKRLPTRSFNIKINVFNKPIMFLHAHYSCTKLLFIFKGKKKIDIAKMYHRSFSTISKHAKKGSGVCIILNLLRQAGHKLKRNAKIDLGFCPLNLRKRKEKKQGLSCFIQQIGCFLKQLFTN